MISKRKNEPNLLALKAKLVSRGITIREFARARHYRAGTVYAALSGRRKGTKTQSILTDIQNL